MPDLIMIEKAELQQIMRWLRDIEENVDFIDKNIEEAPYICLDRCKDIRESAEQNARTADRTAMNTTQS
jgi:hypothetical protein